MRANHWLYKQPGFTLLELMVVLAVAAALLAVSVPSSIKLYKSMEYRSTVADVKAQLESARYQSLIKGRVTDIWVRPRTGRIGLSDSFQAEAVKSVPEGLSLRVVSAAELQRGADTAVIRFYADGSSSGGDVSVVRETGAGVTLHVDWLLGRISQEYLLEP